MEQVFSYIISLGASVMMPILFTIIGLCIGLKFGRSLKSGLYVGVGFVGLGIVTALLTTNFGGPLSEISQLYDLQLKVFDRKTRPARPSRGSRSSLCSRQAAASRSRSSSRR